MKNVLIIGAGRYGVYAAQKLHELGQQIMAIDKDEERLTEILPYTSDAQIGDSTDENYLATLGVSDYDLCIVAIGDNFLASLETTFLLNELGAKKIVARATKATQEKFLLRNGASAVVFPERELGVWTAIRFSTDNVLNYIELHNGYSVMEITVPEEWDNESVGELDVRNKHRINILGTGKEELNMDISVNTVLRAGDRLLVLGKNDDLKKLMKV